MKRVAEIMYIVPEERAEFLKGALNPDCEEARVLWTCGVRNQNYFELNDLIFMTFEYKGHKFEEDMNKMAAYLDSKGKLIKKRRKDVPVEERATTNWWAPVKKLGDILTSKPDFGEDEDSVMYSYSEMLSGGTSYQNPSSDISYSEDEWMESIRIF